MIGVQVAGGASWLSMSYGEPSFSDRYRNRADAITALDAGYYPPECILTKVDRATSRHLARSSGGASQMAFSSLGNPDVSAVAREIVWMSESLHLSTFLELSWM